MRLLKFALLLCLVSSLHAKTFSANKKKEILHHTPIQYAYEPVQLSIEYAEQYHQLELQDLDLGMYKDKLHHIRIEFVSDHPLPAKTADDIALHIEKNINTNKTLRPYLAKHPFPKENIDVTILYSTNKP